MAYISFFKAFGVLKFGMIIVKHFAYYETWLEILHITHIFKICIRCFKRVGTVLSSPYLQVDPFLFLCGIMHL